MDVVEALRQYDEAEKRLHELFGYEQAWRILPIEDNTDCYWMDLGHKIAWAEKPFDEAMIESGKEHYSGAVYTHHMEKRRLSTQTHTMVPLDTQTDGNVVLMIFDNAKECTDAALKNLYGECW